MYDFPLNGAQKTFLRGHGQLMAPSLRVGKGGLTPAFYSEFRRALAVNELVKLRFLDADREERPAWCLKIAEEGQCACVGTVGHTALFYRQNPDPAARRITLP